MLELNLNKSMRIIFILLIFSSSFVQCINVTVESSEIENKLEKDKIKAKNIDSELNQMIEDVNHKVDQEIKGVIGEDNREVDAEADSLADAVDLGEFDPNDI